jgi:hypothetical protein
MARRIELIGQPPSFFSYESIFESPIFQAYWTRRESVLGLPKRYPHSARGLQLRVGI